jgi:asparagine synthase (glutamine-hydrolysing)
VSGSRSLAAEAARYLVADARVDNGSELINVLTAKGFNRDREPTDADLILAAYACWGEQCARHIIGDFSFAIWDASRRRLFLARDHLGVRPCYYHASRHSIAFASEIRQLRQLPGVSDNLNERMIAAHITVTPTPTTWTFFADVKQLAPAHTLVASESNLSLQRYWRLDPQKSIHYKHDSESVKANKNY